MSNTELIMSCALRYALGRRTYIVSVVVDYIISAIPHMSEQCRRVMIKDIRECTNYGDECDKEDWMRLLDELKGEEDGGY